MNIDAGQGDPTPDVQVPADAGGATPAATPPPAPGGLTPDQLYEVKIGGQTRKVALDELRSGYSRTQDYTQKTMALAEERRQLQAQWEAERTQVREFLSKAENVKQLYDYLSTQQQAASPQSNQPLTAQQLQAALAAERTRQQQELTDWQQKQEMAKLENDYKVDISAHVKTILDANPVLRSIHKIDLVLRQAAAEGQPATIEEAKQLMLEKATEQVAALQAHFTEQQKQTAINKGQLARGIEPPGGSAPMPAGKQVGKMGSPEFNADVAEYLRKLTGSAQ